MIGILQMWVGIRQAGWEDWQHLQGPIGVIHIMKDPFGSCKYSYRKLKRWTLKASCVLLKIKKKNLAILIYLVPKNDGRLARTTGLYPVGVSSASGMCAEVTVLSRRRHHGLCSPLRELPPWKEYGQFLGFLQPGLHSAMHGADLNLTHSLKQKYPGHFSKL